MTGENDLHRQMHRGNDIEFIQQSQTSREIMPSTYAGMTYEHAITLTRIQKNNLHLLYLFTRYRTSHGMT